MNFRAALALPKTAGSAQTHKSMNCLEYLVHITLLHSLLFFRDYFSHIHKTELNWSTKIEKVSQANPRSIFFRFGFNPLSNNIVTSNCDKAYKMFSTEVESFRSKNDFPNKVRCGEFQIFRNILIWRHFFR